MDVTFLRITFTVLGFICFIGVCFWAWSNHAKKGFDEAQLIPFDEEFSTIMNRDSTDLSEKGK